MNKRELLLNGRVMSELKWIAHVNILYIKYKSEQLYNKQSKMMFMYLGKVNNRSIKYIPKYEN